MTLDTEENLVQKEREAFLNLVPTKKNVEYFVALVQIITIILNNEMERKNHIRYRWRRERENREEGEKKGKLW